MSKNTTRHCLTVGDAFPDITVQTTLGEIALPADYRGKWFVLFSHPSDFTPVCTTEYVAFQSLSGELAKLNTELIGLSVDQVHTHLKWLEWIGRNLEVDIAFPVIADPAGKVAERLGLLRPGRDTRTGRAVFVVDSQGMIRLTLNYPAEVGRNLYEILRALEAPQTADRNQAATPANWPHNELVGDHLIVPAAANVAEIGERSRQSQTGEINCFDWWFCYKPPVEPVS